MISNQKRRVFLITAVAASSGAAASGVMAQAAKPAALPAVAESDPTAKSLGYRVDTTKVDAKAFPKHAATQNCANCQLYSGKDKEASGPCSIFPGKSVSAKGWCSAWVKKA